MEFLSCLTDINCPFFTVLGYPMSYVEFIGTTTGLVSVWLAARASIFTWHTGLLNAGAFFLIFYQVQLYSDMLLQVYFFGICLYGLWKWDKRATDNSRTIHWMTTNARIWLSALIIICIGILGWTGSHLHVWLPELFSKPASYPYADAFTTVLSIAAIGQMTHKKIESWVMWILVDVVSIGLYILKDIHFIALEYVVLLGIANAGLIQWISFYRHATRTGDREVYARP